MSRLVTTGVVFFYAFNLFAQVLRETGVDEVLHLDLTVGQAEAMSTVGQSSIATGTPTGSTLFGMYNVLMSQLLETVGLIFPGLVMLRRAGVPYYITDMILAPTAVLLTTILGYSYLRGFNL